MQNQSLNDPLSSAPISPNVTPGADYINSGLTSVRPGSVQATEQLDSMAPNTLEQPEGVLDFDSLAESPGMSEPTAVQEVINPRPTPQAKERSGLIRVLVSAAVLAVILLLALTVVGLTRRQNANQQNLANLVDEQGVELGVAEASLLSLEGLQGENERLVVNGDLVARGSVVLTSGSFFGSLQAPGLSGNQTYNLPNASGTICLDSNNCGYLTAAGAVTSLGGTSGVVIVGEGLTVQGNTLSSTGGAPVTSIAGVSGVITLGSNLEMTGNVLSATLPSGLNTTVNGLGNAIVIQGTPDQVVVNTAGQNITLSGPQNLAVSSAPTFASLALTSTGTQAGNVICDISNNCGYLSSANAFLQGGNSFGAPAILGTNDSNAILLETSNTTRVTIGATGNVGIGNTSPNYLLSVGSSEDFAVASNGVVLLNNLAAASTDDVVCRNAANQLATCNNNFAPSSGSGNYIQNGTTLQSNANMTIQSGADGDVTAIIRTRGAQTADLLQLQNSGGGAVSGFSANGQLYFANSGFSNSLGTIALTGNQVVNLPDASGTVCLDSGNCIGAGGSAPADALYLTLAADPSLTNERILTAGSNISFNDGGADNPLTVATVNNPTFSTSVTTPLLQSAGAMAITPGGALTIGATGQSFTLQGSSASTISATSGANTTTLAFEAPTANVTLTVPALAAGTYNICTTSGNCSGTGGGVTTTGGTNGRLAKFTGTQTIADSIIQEAGNVITILGDGVIQGAGGLTVGEASTATGQIVFQNATNGNTLTLQSGATGSNLTFTLPTADGAGGQCIKTNGSGVFSFGDCLSGSGPGGGVTSLNSLAGTLSMVGTTNQVIVNSGGSDITLSTPQDIAAVSSPSFAGLSVTGAGGVTIGTASTATGQLVLQNASNANTITLLSAVAGANRSITIPDASGTVAVSASGNIALSAQGNITFTGELPVVNGGTGASTPSAARSNLGAAASGANGDITSTTALNTITPSSSLTLGASSQSFTLQGTSASTITGSNGGNVTTLGFTTPTANNSILLPNEAGTICLQSSSNCGFVTSSSLIATAFIQGGNSFTAPAILGTNDNNSLSFETGNAIQATIAVGGGTTFKNSTNSAAAFQVQNSANQSIIQADTANSNITLLGNNSGELAGWATEADAITANRLNHSSVIANGYVYVIGGATSTSGTNTVYYAKLNADGSTGAWSTNATNLPAGRHSHGSVVANGYIYVIGGTAVSSGATDTVYYAKLNADGSTGAWSTNANPLPAARASHTSIVANGYVYVIGGGTSYNTGAVDTTYYAKLNADGSTGAWSTNANVLTASLLNHSSVIANGYVYVIGGGAITSGTNTMYYAPLNADGSIGTWITNANNLPGARINHSSVIANGYVYVIGGGTTTNGINTTYYAKLNADGSTGTWSTNTSNLPTNRASHTSVIANGYVYTMGGGTTYNSGASTTVYYASGPRLQVGGSLDLVGLQGQNLANGGDASQGSTGGNLTAGNGVFVGSLQVQGQASFTQGLTAQGNIIVGGGAKVSAELAVGGGASIQNGASIETTAAATKGLIIKGATSQSANLQEWQNSAGTILASVSATGQAFFKNSANSTTAFQVQNAAGTNILQVDTTGSSVNLTRTLVKPLSNSTTAFQVQNAAGTNILQVDSSNSIVNLNASTLIKPPANSTTAFRVQDASSTNVLTVDTTNKAVSVGTAATYSTYTSGASFAAAVNYGTGVWPVGTVAADVNNDTHPDIITANTSSLNVSVLMNNGDGTFASKVDYGVGSACGLAAADVNNDTYVDLVVAGCTNAVSVLLNNGNGTFAAPVNYATTSAYSVALGDFNEDTYPDIVTRGNNSSISVLLNNGNGTFAAKVDYVVGNIAISYFAITAADVNNDTHVDVVINATNVDRVVVLLGNGNGTLASPVDYTTFDDAQGSTVADVNNDTYKDIIVSNADGLSNPTVSILLNNGDGTFAPYINYTAGVYSQGSIATADVNNDTYLDIITGNTNNDRVNVLLNNGNGTFALPVMYNGGDSSAVIVSDVNSDGKPDIITGNQAQGTISVLMNGATLITVNASLSSTISNANNAGLILQAAAGQAVDIMRVQDSLGTGTLFNISRTGNVGIGLGNPGYKLDVNGEVNVRSDLYVGTVKRIDSTGNLLNINNITQTGTATLGDTVIGVNRSFTANGNALFQSATNATTAFQVQNVAGQNLLQIDSANNKLTVFGGLVAEAGAWQTNANTLPANRLNHTSIVANGYAYVIGGATTTTGTNTVYYAQLNGDGTTGAWQTNANTLPANRHSHSTVVANGYVYVIGGGTSNSDASSTVYYAQLNLDGTTGAWQTSANTLPTGRVSHTSVIANGYVYVIGGGSTDYDSGATNTVYYAQLNGDGTTGAWQTNANTLPANRLNHTSIVANGYAYVIGGATTTTGTNTVYYAQLNGDGTTGAWQTNANTLPANRHSHSTVVANGYVYVIGGGTSNSDASSTVYYAQLNLDGTTGAWQTSANTLPTGRVSHTSVIANGYVYVIGGGSTDYDSGATNTVYYASLNTVSSRSLDVGGNLNLLNLYSQATAEEFGTVPIGGSVIALNGDFAGTLTAAGATTLQGGAIISAAAADQEALVVQGATGQTANLQEWQDDTATVLAFIDPDGNLSVADAAVTGTLTVTGMATFNAGITVNGHIITGNSSGVTTIGPEAGAGSGASVSISGNDTSGTVTITTGTGAGAGALATITFANAYGANVRVILTPANGNGSAIQYFVGTANTTTFTVDTNNAPVDSTQYLYNYHVMQ